jgi:hypothetical protein
MEETKLATGGADNANPVGSNIITAKGKLRINPSLARAFPKNSGRWLTRCDGGR